MTTVYVPQIPSFRNRKGEWFPKIDLAPARVFGPIVAILPPGNMRLEDLGTARATMAEYMEGLKPQDFILPIGEPLMIFLLGSVLVDKPWPVRFLRWDRVAGAYCMAELHPAHGFIG